MTSNNIDLSWRKFGGFGAVLTHILQTKLTIIIMLPTISRRSWDYEERRWRGFLPTAFHRKNLYDEEHDDEH
jgi:hypothetical protein